MRMFSSIILLLAVVTSFGQGTEGSKTADQQNAAISRLVVAYSLENQTRELSVAAVRVLARFRIAAWLWKSGTNDSSSAEQIATRAVEDLYDNRNQIPDVYFNALRPELFALLDVYSKPAASKLRAKYTISEESELDLLDSLLARQDGDRVAVEAAIRLLRSRTQSDSEITSLVYRLQQAQSSELWRLLDAVLDNEESGGGSLNSGQLIFHSTAFVGSGVPMGIQKRFLRAVLARALSRSTLLGGQTSLMFNLLNTLLPSFESVAPEMVTDAHAAHAQLRSVASQESRETQEIAERISSSSDKLGATISEAEKASRAGPKYELYLRAAGIALDQGKFNFSAELAEKAADIDLKSDLLPELVRKQTKDQFLTKVLARALDAKAVDSANFVVKRISDVPSRTDALVKLAAYHTELNDLDAGRYALDAAIKNASASEWSPRITASLLNMLQIAQKIDPSSVYELNRLIASSINKIPPPNPEDKLESDAYKRYVTALMIINWNMLSALSKLMKKNPTAAADLAGRIEKKEVKLLADYVVTINSQTVPSSEK